MYIFRLKVSVGKINEGLGVKNNDKKPFHIQESANIVWKFKDHGKRVKTPKYKP